MQHAALSVARGLADHDVVARVELDRQHTVVLEQRVGLARGLVGQRGVARLVETVGAVHRVAVRVVEDAQLELEREDPGHRVVDPAQRHLVLEARHGEVGRARVGAAHHVGTGVGRVDPGRGRQPVRGDQTGVAHVLPQVGEDLGAVTRAGTARVEIRTARVARHDVDRAGLHRGPERDHVVLDRHTVVDDPGLAMRRPRPASA